MQLHLSMCSGPEHKNVVRFWIPRGQVSVLKSGWMEEEASDGGLCPLLSFIGGEFYLYHPNYTSTVPQWPRADSAAINTDGKHLDDLCKIISYISNLRLSA